MKQFFIALLTAVTAHGAAISAPRTTAARAGAATVSPRLLTGHRARIKTIAFSPDGRMLASSSGDRTVRLWSVETGELRRTIRTEANVIAFTPDSRLLATTAGRSTLSLWDGTRGRAKRTLSFSGTSIGSLAFSPDGHLLALTDERHNRLLLVDTRTWRIAHGLKGDPTIETRRGPEFSAWAGVTAARFSADGRLLVTQHADSSTDLAGIHSSGWVRLWDATTWGPIRKLEPEAGARYDLMTLAVAPDGRHVVGATTAYGASLLTVWDTGTGAARLFAGEFEGRCQSLAYAARGKVVVVGMEDGSGMGASALLLDTATGRKLCSVATDRVPTRTRTAVAALAVSAGGQLMATASPGNRIRIWRVSELLAGGPR
jgi:WD40 repeat protein